MTSGLEIKDHKWLNCTVRVWSICNESSSMRVGKLWCKVIGSISQKNCNCNITLWALCRWTDSCLTKEITNTEFNLHKKLLCYSLVMKSHLFSSYHGDGHFWFHENQLNHFGQVPYVWALLEIRVVLFCQFNKRNKIGHLLTLML